MYKGQGHCFLIGCITEFLVADVLPEVVKSGSGVMSGTKLTPNRALANARLGTIKINTQFGCRPHCIRKTRNCLFFT